MSDIKSKVQGLNPSVEPRDIQTIAKNNGNIYEVLSIISKRANQLSVDLKEELLSKLREFAVVSETIEEIQENKEQIEISKFYERLPNPVLIALNEFLSDEISFDYRKREDQES